MSNRILPLTEDLYRYLLSVSLREPEPLAQLRQEAAQHPRGQMQIAPDQGQLIQLLLKLMQAETVLEIGVFTGYSSTAIALALPDHGKLVACDISDEYTAIARRYWRSAGVADKIALHVAPALETLDNLIADGGTDAFDAAFIDADKSNYDAYYERSLRLVRPGGLIMIDNVLWSGRVADPAQRNKRTTTLRNLNQKIHRDERVFPCLLPVADGLTLALKR
ncbi:MAG: class I SAM-dependent methyltransferase [Elainellaceae cyanobacterium]